MKRRKFLNHLVLTGTTVWTIKGCGASNETTVRKSPGAGSFRVAIALPQEVEDLGWSRSGYQGLKLIEKELLAGVAYKDKVDLPPKQDFEKIFTEYAEEGFDFIIGHGGQFEAALIAVAQQFPRQKFALMGTYPGNNRNLGALSVRSGELGYLAGVIAALKTKTEKIATIGGMPMAATKEGLELFERGATTINPKIEVFEGWVNSFADAVKAKNIAEKAIAWGADVIGADFRGALTAAEEEIVDKVRQDILTGKIDVSPRG